MCVSGGSGLDYRSWNAWLEGGAVDMAPRGCGCECEGLEVRGVGASGSAWLAGPCTCPVSASPHPHICPRPALPPSGPVPLQLCPRPSVPALLPRPCPRPPASSCLILPHPASSCRLTRHIVGHVQHHLGQQHVLEYLGAWGGWRRRGGCLHQLAKMRSRRPGRGRVAGRRRKHGGNARTNRPTGRGHLRA